LGTKEVKEKRGDGPKIRERKNGISITRKKKAHAFRIIKEGGKRLKMKKRKRKGERPVRVGEKISIVRSWEEGREHFCARANPWERKYPVIQKDLWQIATNGKKNVYHGRRKRGGGGGEHAVPIRRKKGPASLYPMQRRGQRKKKGGR